MTGATDRGNLPTPLTSFVGRQSEIDVAADLLERHRLVTLTGPGGAGKTALAVRIAGAAGDHYPDGRWWVDLGGIADEAEVAEAVAATVGVPVVGEPLAAVRTHLAGRRLLLCLDNAEHLLDAVAGVVEAIRRGGPTVTFLVTSREPLGVPGEAVLPVPPLTDEDALALFLDRALLVRPTFALDEENLPAVRSIIAHLDGIPLALELAAAWLRTLTPRQIESGLDDRFLLLVRGPRGAERRQRTLAGSIDWSHALLTEPERVIFRRLAVFGGGFSLEAAQYTCADDMMPATEVLTGLGRLVDKSLIMVDEHAGQARYRMLETIRAYASARLLAAREDAAVRDRQLQWCLHFVEAGETEREQDSDRWRRDLLLEYDNLRAALDWGLAADDGAAGRRLAAALAWLWHLDRRGREGIGYLRRAIARAPDDRSLLQARLLTGFALVADTAEPLDVEYDAATRAQELATAVGDDGLRALCLNLRAVGRFYTDFDAAWQLCDEAYAAAKAAGNTFVLGGSRALQAIILHLRDQHADAEALADETVRDHLRSHRGVLSTLLTYQAGGAAATGDPARGLELAAHAVQVAEPLGDYLRVGSARSRLAQILAMTGDLAGASEAVEPVLRLVNGADGEVFVPGLAQAMAVLSMRRGDFHGAIQWLRPAADSTDRGEPTWIAVEALPALGAATAAAGRNEEAMAILETAVSLAQRRDMPGPLAAAYAAQADLAPTAIELHHAALAIRVEHGLHALQPESLEAVARCGATVQPAADDVRILYAAQAARVAMNLPRTADQQHACEETASRLREALGDTAFDQAAAEGAGLPLGQAVDYARRGRGRRGRPASGWASLTPTELDVVRLVAGGLTNPQIGAKLFISRGTVKTHLSHILAKLGASNRTEIAAAAADRGLLPDQ